MMPASRSACRSPAYSAIAPPCEKPANTMRDSPECPRSFSRRASASSCACDSRTPAMSARLLRSAAQMSYHARMRHAVVDRHRPHRRVREDEADGQRRRQAQSPGRSARSRCRPRPGHAARSRSLSDSARFRVRRTLAIRLAWLVSGDGSPRILSRRRHLSSRRLTPQAQTPSVRSQRVRSGPVDGGKKNADGATALHLPRCRVNGVKQ